MNTALPVDLTTCDREPIHIPGSIQPNGCLIATDTSGVTVLRHSDNLDEFISGGGDRVGGTLLAVLGPEATHTIRNALAACTDGGRPAVRFAVPVAGRAFDLTIHRFKGVAIIELEFAGPPASGPLEMARAVLGRLNAIQTVDKLLRDTSRLVQAMLGYDRVMVYRFGQDGAGRVMSEARRGDLESFLGQYFPASDIPSQARALYLRNTIRTISNVDFLPVPVLPQLDASGEPLDLSFAHLRSVSPIHCEYLRNMGVAASMSISIIIEGQLWGLVACHHYAPRQLSMAERVSAELFGDFLSLHLNAIQTRQRLEAVREARTRLDEVLREATGAADITRVFRKSLPNFARLFDANGVGVWIGGEWSVSGEAPQEGFARTLVDFAGGMTDGRIWATHHLASALPSAERHADTAAGALVIPLSRRPRDYLVFFRKEVVQTLDWAGNPEKVYEVGPLGDRLTPRKSFAIWKETVRLQSIPWTEEERAFAEAVRLALTEVLLQHSEMLEDEREKSAVRQRMLNEELNHRVKNILAIIKSLVAQQRRAGEDVDDYVETLRARIKSLAFAHDQVIRGDGGGGLAELFEAELSPYVTADSDIAIEGAPVWLETRAYSVLALVIHELSTNAAKYGALSRPGGSVSATWRVTVAGVCEIAWRETGGPRVTPPSRRGFGTELIERSIPFDLGGESDIRYDPDGVTAEFSIPPRFVGAQKGSRKAKVAQAPQPRFAPAPILPGARMMIVEDELLIAMELEMIMEQAGVEVVGVARSSVEALALLDKTVPSFAVLDVNLGDETSLPVAVELARRGVPFIFATGYGEDVILPVELAGAPVVRKPYAATEIWESIHRQAQGIFDGGSFGPKLR